MVQRLLDVFYIALQAPGLADQITMATHLYEAKTLDRVKRKFFKQRGVLQEDSLEQRTRAASIDSLYTGTRVKNIPEFSLRVVARSSTGEHKMWCSVTWLWRVLCFRGLTWHYGSGCGRCAEVHGAAQADGEASAEPEGQTEAQYQEQETESDTVQILTYN